MTDYQFPDPDTEAATVTCGFCGKRVSERFMAIAEPGSSKVAAIKCAECILQCSLRPEEVTSP